MKRVLTVSFEVLFLLTAVAVVIFLGIGIYSLTVLKVDLDISAITDNNLSIEVYNSENLLLKESNSFNGVNVKLEYLPEHTKSAFISIEDKDFYTHNGINPKRMAKAFVNNLKKMSIVEGASTITQQLIKNTHLSNEKTFTRKINEISLALKLEKAMPKNQILENYLNTIYFGNNCYGIENASQYYFSKTAKDLDISQSALLAGIIKSPNYNSPTRQPERSLKRRNLVLSEMLEDKKITLDEYKIEKNKEINLNLNKKIKNKLNSYSQSAIDEAMDILKMPEKQIAIGGYKIYTYQNLEKQTALENAINNYVVDENDYSLIDIDSKNGGVLAYLGKSDYKILDHKRQPGSIIKPILVYAPAINENILSPATQILNEQISIDGYTPHNIGNNYGGYVSTRDALAKSLNSPAVKTATYVGLNKISNYAKQLEIELDSKDYNYSLALGGMTYGTNLKTLAGAYTALANNGFYTQPKFVYYITTSGGKIVYKNPQISKQVFRDDTAYLTTDILKTCAKQGTAKKLADLPFEVASKTGTVGTKTNTDAYNVAYTTQDIIGVWFGNMDNSPIDTAGGNVPTMVAKDFLKAIYKSKKPSAFTKPHSVEEIEIDTTELDDNHNVVKASLFTPQRYKTKELFSRFNLPKDNGSSLAITPTILSGKVKDSKAILTFNANNYLTYEVYKISNNKTSLIKTFSEEKGAIEFYDDLIQNQKVSYYVITKLNNDNETNSAKSNIINLLNTKNNSNSTTKAKWYV